MSNPTETLTTVRDYLRYAVSKFNQHDLFYGHGTDNAYDEAVSLILQSLQLPIDQLEPYLDAKLLADEKELIIKRILCRINERLPLAYITNKAYLQGYEFYVDQRVIIPRSFIAEIIVNNYLKEWITYPELIHNALDLCTGNASLAVILAEYFPDAQIVATDISMGAIEVATTNIVKYNLEDKIKLIRSDLFDALDKNLNRFDLIVTNPPYVDQMRMQALPLEYQYEPSLALDGGGSGLIFIERILSQAKNYLTEFGILVVEMGDNGDELVEHYPDLPFKWIETPSQDGWVFVLTQTDLEDYFD